MRSLPGLSSTGLNATLGASPQASACIACARPISPPSGVTTELFDMFCALNGATATPRRASQPADPGDQGALAGVRGRARHQQCPTHVASIVSLVRFLLRPGWLALIALVVGFAVAGFTLLAPWQFGREQQRDAQQRAIDTATALAPVPLAELVPPATQWHAKTSGGRSTRQRQLPPRRRGGSCGCASWTGSPPSRCSLRSAPTTVGCHRRPRFRHRRVRQRGAGLPAAPGRRRHAHRAAALDETDPQGRAVIESDGHRQVYAADSRALAAATGLALESGLPAARRRAAGRADARSTVAPTSGGEAPFTNLSYALQWLTFGVIALFALGYFVRLELLQRRDIKRGPGRRAERTALRRALAGDDEPMDRTGER